MNSAKLYVKGLNFRSTTDTLTNYFSKFGELTHANVVLDRLSGRSRGFGFVTFRSLEDAKRALEDTHHEIDGRSVTVSEAVEREGGFHPSGGFAGRGGFYGSGFPRGNYGSTDSYGHAGSRSEFPQQGSGDS